jgi:hypothetical protein
MRDRERKNKRCTYSNYSATGAHCAAAASTQDQQEFVPSDVLGCVVVNVAGLALYASQALNALPWIRP